MPVPSASAPIETLHQEIVATVVSYLDKPSLLALLRTKRFLRPHAEYQLYRRVDFRPEVTKHRWNPYLSYGRDNTRAQIQRSAVDFLLAIVNNRRLGTLVRSFYPGEVDEDVIVTGTGVERTVDLLPYAIENDFFPNLKSIALYHPRTILGCPKSPCQLERLGIYIQNPIGFPRDLPDVLQHQPGLRHFSLMFAKSTILVGAFSSSKAPAPKDLCPALEVLEGPNSAIQFLLPNHARIKSLFWECTRPYKGEWLDPHGRRPDVALRAVDVDLRDSFFTPELCEAYGRLENLVLSNQIWFLPLLSPYFKSLKTLLLSIKVAVRSQRAPWDERLFLRAIGEMKSLEMLVVTWGQDYDPDEKYLDPEVVFGAASKTNLKYFAISVHGRGSAHVPVFVERQEDGRICRVGSEKFEEVWYLHKGWFNYGTEDGRMDGNWTGFGPRIFVPE